tara:strand:+ start:959 stop:1408 length:450 start_codon:yes stop_codon:yes gene_type:complete
MSEPKAEQIFFDIYEKEIAPLLPDKPEGSNNFELDRVGKKLLGKKYIGTYASDKIPRDKQGYFIVNLDKSNQKGSHWVGVVRDSEGAVVFDSFGRDTKEILPFAYKDFGKYVETENDAEQDVLSSICGGLSMAWLLFFSRYGRDNAILI